MTLRKDHIINSVHNHLNLPKTKSAQVVESLLETMKKTRFVVVNEGGVFYISTKLGQGAIINDKKAFL